MKRLRKIFVVLVGVLAVFVLANVLAAVWLSYYDKHINKYHNLISLVYRMDLSRFYPGLSAVDIDQLISENFQYMQYEPYMGFRERPRQGRFVNVSEHGFRASSGQSPWPPRTDAPIIFVFGGSTTFGYGVEDKETVVSHLSDKLRRNPALANAQLYNFGRGFYWSTQEAILFQRLLARGNVPTVAIFIDGVNEFYYRSDDPVYADLTASLLDERFTDWSRATVRRKWEYVRKSLTQALLFLPVGRLVQQWNSQPPEPPRNQASLLLPNDPQALERSIRNYRFNVSLIRAIAREFGVKPFFVWHPAPTYHNPSSLAEQHDRDFAARVADGYGPHSQSHYGYPKMAEIFAEARDDKSMIWCADAFQDAKQQLYVDPMHFNSYGAGVLADCIADHLPGAN